MKSFLSTSVMLVLAILFISSCHIKDQFLFQKDWSGVHEGTLNYNEESINNGENLAKDIFISERDSARMTQYLSTREGISDVSIQNILKESPHIKFRYSFEDLDAINKLDYRGLDDEKSIITAMVKWNFELLHKKALKIDINRALMSDAPKDKDVCRVTTIFTFRKKVKSLVSEVAKMGESKNDIIVSYDITEVNDLTKNWKIEVGF